MSLKGNFARLGGWPGVVRDFHVYGGAAIAAFGLGFWIHSGLGLAVFGSTLVFVGVRR